MIWSPLQLRNLALLSPTKAPANIDFKSGVNVICGASDTGKSFIVEAIDFLLGGTKPLRDIPERIGYDRGRISIFLNDENIYTFEQSVEGGEYKKFDGKLSLQEVGKEWTKIKSKHAHGKDDNISGLFLSKIGLFEKRVRKNAKGDTQSFSFRDLARLIIVQENEIIKRDSPFLTGQYVTRTSEYSALKLLLTGVDDSSLVAETEQSKTSSGVSAKIELIEQWLSDLQTEIEDIGVEREDIEDQIERLEKSIDNERKSLEKSQRNLNSYINSRRDLYSEKEKIKDRISEINELLDRFNLLNNHYQIDIERLHAIQESGSLFIHQEIVACPLCGALPEHQHHHESQDEDVEIIVHAASVEIEKINRLSIELSKTVIDLKEELNELNKQITDIEERYNSIDVEIRETISADVGKERTAFGELVDKRSDLRKKLEMFERIDSLEQQKKDLLKETDIKITSESSRTDLSKTILDEFAEQIEKLLKAWHFPDADRVYFDEETFDFVINGKARGSRGKGLRAITHAAVTIGLMEYCKKKSLPHPGFVVLDSPLLSYWEPEGPDDDLKGTDLKDMFYEYLVSEHSDTQIIIIENEHPSDNLLDRLSFTDFTKNPNQGRYGFFPNI
jgi:hypothetical protein